MSMKNVEHPNLNHHINYDEIYRISLEQGKVERSNLEANVAFLESTGLLSREKRILEIGCGAGSLSNYFCERGYDITSIEISKVALERAKELYKGLTVYQMSAEKLEFQDNYFDIVLSFDVLEHIPAVDAHLREVQRVLRGGGYYLFQTPNKYTNIPFEVVKDRSLKYRIYHPSLQSYLSLKRLMDKNGFDIKVIKQPISNKFTQEKIEAVFGKFFSKLFAKVNWQKIPIILYPNFYVIAAVQK